MIGLELRSIARSWPAWVLAGFLVLIEALPGNRVEVFDAGDYLYWLRDTLSQAAFWVGVVAVMLAQRDRHIGMDELLIPSTLSSLRYVLSQFSALLLAACVVAALLALTVFLRDPPSTWAGFQVVRLLGPLEMLLLVTAVGLLVGHAFRSPLAIALPVLAWLGLSFFSQTFTHTFTPMMAFGCSRILGCPDLPYAQNFLFYLAISVGLIWLVLKFSDKQLNASSLQRQGATAITLLALALAASTVPGLAQAAKTYPRPNWQQATAWPKPDLEHPESFDTPEYRAKLECAAGLPTVCFLPGQKLLAQRTQAALQRLERLKPGWHAANVIAYPDVNVFSLKPMIKFPETVYVSERKLWEARVLTQITITTDFPVKSTRHVVVPTQFNLMHEILDLELHGRSRTEPKRQADGSMMMRYSSPSDARSMTELYLEWLALREDPAWNPNNNGLEVVRIKTKTPTGKIVEVEDAAMLADGIAGLLPEARSIWKLGEQHGHEKVVRAITQLETQGLLGALKASKIKSALQAILQAKLESKPTKQTEVRP